jgi:hypothetical protein
MGSIGDIRNRLEHSLNTGNVEETIRCLNVVNEQGWNLDIGYSPASDSVRSARVSRASKLDRTKELIDASSEQTLVVASIQSLSNMQIGRESPNFPSESSRSQQSVPCLSLDSDRLLAFESSHSSKE